MAPVLRVGKPGFISQSGARKVVLAGLALCLSVAAPVAARHSYAGQEPSGSPLQKLVAEGTAAAKQGDPKLALSRFQEAVPLAEKAGNEALLGTALSGLGWGQWATGQYEEALNGDTSQVRASEPEVRSALIDVSRSRRALTPLTLTFDHLHSLHGGLVLTVRGDGTVQQQAVRTKAGEPKDKVTHDDLKALVALLVKHEVWTQRVEERLPRPDESIAALKTCYRDQCVEIWEWYNDLEKNARIGDVLQLMQTIAWKPAAPRAWTVTVETTGGFTGRGAGAITAASTGSVRTGGGFWRPCSAQLSDSELQPLSKAVAEAKPASWDASYVRPNNPHGCCDQFRYSLTLEVDHAGSARTQHSTFWYSEMTNELPLDLRAVFEASSKIKGDADAKCHPR